jgi:serine/threonine protein kinase
MIQKKIDKYVIIVSERLGKGSFAEVFKGRLAEGTQEFAIKVIEKKLLKQDEYLRYALFNEISIMKKVNSEFIVHLEEVLVTSNNYYIIQEFCNSGELRTLLRKHGRFGEKEAREMLRHMLAGFQPLLKSGIIHRDLKPENILIHNDTLKIADFGFAKNLHNFKNQMLTSAVGTPLYMSPQILREEPYSSKSDVWSIGLILFEILHGAHPFPARSEKELLKKIEGGAPALDAGLSQSCREFILGCLRPREEDRLSWDQVYRHPFVAEFFRAYIEEENKLEDRATFIINKLRVKVIENNLDLEELFKFIDSSKDGTISKKELYKLLMSIDRGISKDEVVYIFNKFDNDGNGAIEFEEFREWMIANDIRMKPQQGLPGSPEEQKAIEAVQKIKDSIAVLGLELHDFFAKFGKHNKEEMAFPEFKNMLLLINKDLRDPEVEIAFKKFDVNGDGQVSFEEFKSLLYKISGKAQVHDPEFKEKLEAALKTL